MSNNWKFNERVPQLPWKTSIFNPDDFDDDYDPEKTEEVALSQIINNDEVWDNFIEKWDKNINKKEILNDNNIKEIDLAWKEISWIYWQYGVNLIHNWNIKIKKWKLKIINKYKENKTEYEIVIENWTLETWTGDNMEIDYYLDSIESIKFNILFKNYKNKDFTFNNFSIDLWDNIFSLDEWKTLYKTKKENIKWKTWITEKISSLISLILLKKK